VTHPLFLWPQVILPKSLSLLNLLGEYVKLAKWVLIKDPPIIVISFFFALNLIHLFEEKIDDAQTQILSPILPPSLHYMTTLC
jgi:hypothetical protein